MSKILIQQYKERLARIQDSGTAAEEVIQLIDNVRDQAGFGETIQEFLQAGGIGVLVELACREWPSDGRLTKSKAWIDKVVTVTGDSKSVAGRLLYETPLEHIFNREKVQSVRYPCSIRRMAICTLAEMGNYQ